MYFYGAILTVFHRRPKTDIQHSAPNVFLSSCFSFDPNGIYAVFRNQLLRILYLYIRRRKAQFMPYVETMNHTSRNFVRTGQATCRHSYLDFGQTSPDHGRTYVHLAHGKGIRTNDFHPQFPSIFHIFRKSLRTVMSETMVVSDNQDLYR